MLFERNSIVFFMTMLYALSADVDGSSFVRKEYFFADPRTDEEAIWELVVRIWLEP